MKYILILISVCCLSGCFETTNKITTENVIHTTSEAIDIYLEYKETKEQDKEVKEEITKDTNTTSIETKVDNKVSSDQKILENADYSTLLRKYMTPEGIINAPNSMTITSNSYRDIYCDTGEVYENVGFFPIAITTSNKVYHGGHGYKGGARPPITRNTGLSGRSAEDYGIPTDKIKYYFLIMTGFEGRGRIVYKRSQLKEV